MHKSVIKVALRLPSNATTQEARETVVATGGFYEQTLKGSQSKLQVMPRLLCGAFTHITFYLDVTYVEDLFHSYFIPVVL